MGACARCGQTSLVSEGLCPDCTAGLYGGRERHEAPRLFAPAPAPMRGQLDIRLDADGFAQFPLDG